MSGEEKLLVTTEIVEQIKSHIAEHFDEVLKVKGDDGQLNFGISVQIEVAENGQHTVSTKLSFSEKHSFLIEKDIADPNQPDLGGEVGEASAPKRKRSKKT